MGRVLKACIVAGLTAALPSVGAPLKAAGNTWPGTWPPVTSIKCPRNNAVPFAWQNKSIGGELTQLHANRFCVPQPTCLIWTLKESKKLPGPVSGDFWLGSTSYPFTIADQNTIVANARAAAIAQTPAGKRFYRLTFANPVIVGQQQQSSGLVQATAHYGKCSDIGIKTGPERHQ